jgi:hypothetical protein
VAEVALYRTQDIRIIIDREKSWFRHGKPSKS